MTSPEEVRSRTATRTGGGHVQIARMAAGRRRRRPSPRYAWSDGGRKFRPDQLANDDACRHRIAHSGPVKRPLDGDARAIAGQRPRPDDTNAGAGLFGPQLPQYGTGEQRAEQQWPEWRRHAVQI